MCTHTRRGTNSASSRAHHFQMMCKPPVDFGDFRRRGCTSLPDASLLGTASGWFALHPSTQTRSTPPANQQKLRGSISFHPRHRHGQLSPAIQQAVNLDAREAPRIDFISPSTQTQSTPPTNQQAVNLDPREASGIDFISPSTQTHRHRQPCPPTPSAAEPPPRTLESGCSFRKKWRSEPRISNSSFDHNQANARRD
jgi:hypothetical protein